MNKILAAIVCMLALSNAQSACMITIDTNQIINAEQLSVIMISGSGQAIYVFSDQVTVYVTTKDAKKHIEQTLALIEACNNRKSK